MCHLQVAAPRCFVKRSHALDVVDIEAEFDEERDRVLPPQLRGAAR
jgi:hypothetical protein